ncbi:MAG: tetratricopeptide repeat protein, partial [Planctomycetes bacterium]|nr:tetratricopeptide repeat protein [Planctomycetota bacterium]
EPLRVKLIDFGLSQPDSTPLGARVRGTFPYMSPEMLRNSVVDRRSDLYSLGATLFVLVTGQDPFEGHTRREMIRRIIEDPPPRVRARNPGVPEPLAAVIDRLLAKDPAQRFAGAADVIEELSRTGPRRFAIETPETRASAIHGGKLVGRVPELRAFEAEVEALDVEESDCALILVEGETGLGRTRLLEEVVSLAQMGGATVVSGACPPGTAIPFSPWKEIFEELRDHVDLGEPRFARFLPALASLLPDIPARSDPPPPLAPSRARARQLDALARLVLEVAGGSKMIVWIRNLERADEASLGLLEALARAIRVRRGAGRAEVGSIQPGVTPIPPSSLEEERSAPYPRILLCATAEPASHAGEALERLGALEGVRRIVLGALPREGTEELIVSRLGPSALTARAIDELHARSRGIPLALENMLAALLAARSDQDDGPLRVGGDDVRRLPDNAAEYARRAAEGLDEEGERALDVLSVTRFPLPPEGVAYASGADIQGIERALDGLVERRLVRIHRIGGRATHWLESRPLAQERAGRIAAARTRQLHRRLADWFAKEGWPGADPEPEVYHAIESGQAKRAVHAALRTARRYAGVLAFERARDLVKLALEIAGTRAFREEELAEIACIAEAAGDRAGAIEILGAAADLVGDPARQSALARRIGEIALAAGDHATAQPMLERAVALAEEPEGAAELPAALDACAGLHLARGQIERAQALHDQAAERRRTAATPEERAKHLRLGARILAARDRQAEALAALREAVGLLRDGEPSGSLGEALNELGRSHAAKGDYDGAVAAYREAFEIYERLGDKLGLAEAAGNAGEAFYSRGDHERAREYYGRSLALREEAGDAKGKANALNNLGLVHGMRNDARAARACFEKSLEILSAIGDEAGSAVALNNMSKLHELEGRYAEALDASFRALEKRKRVNNRSGIAFSYYRIGHIYRHQGELEKARGYAEKSLRLRKELGDRIGIAHGYRLLGDIEFARGNLFEAFRHFRQSLSSFESFGDRIGRV